MSLTDDLNQHNVQLQRIITRLLNSDVYPTLDANARRAIGVLNEYGELTSQAQVNRILREIRALNSDPIKEAWEAVTNELNETASYEAAYYANLMQTYGAPLLNVPAATKVQNYIGRSLMSLGADSPQTGTWAQFVRGNIDAVASEYDNVIKSGFARGQTIREVSQSIRRVTDGKAKNWAESLARTGMSHYAERAHEAMALDNDDIIKKKYLLVTFDNRTSFICMHYGSSKKNPWKMGDDKAPVLPLHYNERSTYVYLVEGQDEPSGIRPAVGGKGDKRAREIYEARRKRTDKKVKYRGRRDSDVFDVEQVRASTSYDSWFARQPAWFQDDILGKTKGRLYRQGGLELSRFTDMTGRELTLVELRIRDAKAFELAGLDE